MSKIALKPPYYYIYQHRQCGHKETYGEYKKKLKPILLVFSLLFK
jgi:hypothetical protein